MTRTMIALLATVALVLASTVTVPAQGKKGSTPKPQQVSSKGTTTKASSPKTTNAGAKTTKGGPKTTTAKATGTKTTSSPGTKLAKADAKTTTKSAKADAKTTTKSAKADAKSTTKSAKADTKTTTSEKPSTSTTASATTSTTTTPGDGDTPVTLTKVQERLQKNTKLAERLEGRLPKGADLMEAADGFKNLGQFVAAVNVSSNLRLDFEKLKTAMVDDGRSLGQAIQYVKTDVENPTLVAQRAESEALTLIQQTEKTTAATTTATTTSTTSQKTKPKDKPKGRNGSGS